VQGGSGHAEALLGAFDTARVGALGGRVVLRFLSTVPVWLTDPLRSYLGAHDLGPSVTRVTYNAGMRQYPRGGNVAVRRRAALAAGGFRTMFGRRGHSLRSNDELDLCYRLEAAGWELRYVHEAAVDHLVLGERLDPAWFLRRFGAQGTSDALFQLVNRGARRAFGRLRWYYGARLFRRRYTPAGAPDPVRLLAECERREAWGYVGGLAAGLPFLMRMPSSNR